MTAAAALILEAVTNERQPTALAMIFSTQITNFCPS
jgi:hypothetical protein